MLRLRTIAGPLLVGLGVFLFVSAGLVRFYAYPALARVPASYDRTTHLEAMGAVVFNGDPAVLAPEETDLSIVSRTVADTGADAPDGVVVWHDSVTIARSDGTIFQQSRERAPFDSATGEASHCEKCGSWVETVRGEQVATEREGLVYKFPFNTQKKDYPIWDQALGEATPADYTGEETLQGLSVYRFEQVVDPTVIETLEVPGSVFGLETPSVEAEVVYAVRVTYYVEPVTGSPVQRVEERTQELRHAGVSVPAFVGTIQYTDAEVDEIVDDLRVNSVILRGMHSFIPAALLVVGIILLGIGVVLERKRRRSASRTRQARVLSPVEA